MYEIRKGSDGKWKLQMPKGILSYRTKRDAESMAAACKAAQGDTALTKTQAADALVIIQQVRAGVGIAHIDLLNAALKIALHALDTVAGASDPYTALKDAADYLSTDIG